MDAKYSNSTGVRFVAVCNTHRRAFEYMTIGGMRIPYCRKCHNPGVGRVKKTLNEPGIKLGLCSKKKPRKVKRFVKCPNRW